MKTTATMALLLGLFAAAAAPDADARGFEGRALAYRQERPDVRPWGMDHRKIRVLANRIERATDELQRDARRIAGRLDRREAHALRAIRKLERAADELSRELRGRHIDRGLVRDLRVVARRFEVVLDRADALPRSRELRRDLLRVDRLIDALEHELAGGRPQRLAWRDRGDHFARR
jgi:hypothetical protein